MYGINSLQPIICLRRVSYQGKLVVRNETFFEFGWTFKTDHRIGADSPYRAPENPVAAA